MIVSFKYWVHMEAARLGIKPGALEMRISRGTHKRPKSIIRHNARRIEVKIKS